jgi:hypothetical protein
MTLQERYDKLCATPSSINEHLPTLRDYAARCNSVAEFGVDIGQSTTAFLMGSPKCLASFDVVRKPELDELFNFSQPLMNYPSANRWHRQCGDTEWWFLLMDSRKCMLDPATDLLFIDSSHCYDQMAAELARHHAQVIKWIICHDTIAYGEFGEAGPPQVGINPAIDEFLARHPEWVRLEHFTNNNGLLVLERQCP